MTIKEKIDLLIEYDDLKVLSYENFLMLKKLSCDTESIVRSMTARFFVEFINEESRKILFKLAVDEDNLVRTEAYDSLKY